VTKNDILDVTRANEHATIVADLCRPVGVPSEVFDCIIFTQTLHVIEEPDAAIQTLYRMLKPGGVVLATLPGISQIRKRDWGGYWCGGDGSARHAFARIFGTPHVAVRTYGNVLTAIAFLEGLGVVELMRKELDYWDPDYEVTVAVRAVKNGDRQEAER
jgi:SAM-dependent methyltransferase